MKLIYIDVETTGIPCPQSGFIQLAGAIEIDCANPVFFQYDIQPFPSTEFYRSLGTSRVVPGTNVQCSRGINYGAKNEQVQNIYPARKIIT